MEKDKKRLRRQLVWKVEEMGTKASAKVDWKERGDERYTNLSCVKRSLEFCELMMFEDWILIIVWISIPIDFKFSLLYFFSICSFPMLYTLYLYLLLLHAHHLFFLSKLSLSYIHTFILSYIYIYKFPVNYVNYV